MCVSCQLYVGVHNGGRGPAHVNAHGQGRGGQKYDFFVDVINGWSLTVTHFSLAFLS